MPENARMRLYNWGARSLFIGPAFGLSPHRNAVDVLAVGMDAPFMASLGDKGDYHSHRLLHIRANSLHHLTDIRGRMAFLYIDPFDSDREAIAALDEAALIDILTDLADDALEWREARAMLTARLEGRPRMEADPRIRHAIALIHADPAGRPTLVGMARKTGLSPSRFRHLFVAATGVPFRRYRLWIAMGAAIRAAASGESLTMAALDAGFSSSAHFSAAFREMFGMAPAALIGALPVMVTPVRAPAAATARS